MIEQYLYFICVAQIAHKLRLYFSLIVQDIEFKPKITRVLNPLLLKCFVQNMFFGVRIINRRGSLISV